MAQEIILSPDGSQKFKTTLDNTTYEFIISYNTRVGTWFANIYSEGEVLIEGVGLVGGVDILDQYTLDLKNLFVINLDNTSLDPGPDNLGISAKLYKLTNEEVLGG